MTKSAVILFIVILPTVCLAGSPAVASLSGEACLSRHSLLATAEAKTEAKAGQLSSTALINNAGNMTGKALSM